MTNGVHLTNGVSDTNGAAGKRKRSRSPTVTEVYTAKKAKAPAADADDAAIIIADGGAIVIDD